MNTVKRALASLMLSTLLRQPTDQAVANMAESLRSLGQLTPIGVNHKGEVLFGVTRYLAAKKLGWKDITVRVFDESLDPGEAYRIAVCENTVRSQMTFIEKADAIHEYAKQIHGSNKEFTASDLQQAGKELGFSKSDITKCLRPHRHLTPENKKRLLDAGIGGTLAYLYAKETDPQKQTRLIAHGIKHGWKRADLERHFKPKKKQPKSTLEYRHTSGKLRMEFPSDLDAARLIDILKSISGDMAAYVKRGLSLETIADALKEQSHAVASKKA